MQSLAHVTNLKAVTNFSPVEVWQNCTQQLCDLTTESYNNLNCKRINKLKPDKSATFSNQITGFAIKQMPTVRMLKKHILVFYHHSITELTSDKGSAKIVLFKYTCKILLRFAFTCLQIQSPTNPAVISADFSVYSANKK